MTGRTWTVGLDLGQAHDYSAIVVVERVPAVAPKEPPDYHVRHLDRWERHTPYPRIVADVAALVAQPPLAGAARLVVDRTGVGRAVSDYFRDAGARSGATGGGIRCPMHGITITAGDQVRREGPDYWTPKRDVVGVVSVTLQTGRLKIAPDLPHAATLVRELQDFKAKISAAGHDSYGVAEDWREGQNDDLVLALGLALWAAEHIQPGRIWTF